MKKMDKLRNYSGLKITVASPEMIREWSYGEVTKPETINYRTFRAEREGLFDERIFGPTKDYECYCGKYKRIRYKGVICEKCGVEVTHKRVRRERMGHLKLATPCAHAWYFRGVPSKLGLLLDISPRYLESVIYFSRHIVVKVDFVQKAKVISEIEKERDEKILTITEEYNSKVGVEKEASTKEVKALSKSKGTKEELAQEDMLLQSRKRIAIINEQFGAKKADLEEHYANLLSNLEKIDYRMILSDLAYMEIREYADRFARIGMGAEAVREILTDINLEELSKELRLELATATGQNKVRIIKRLTIVEGLISGKVRPEWTIMTLIPITPPDLRPMVQLEGGRFATSDLNDLYRAVINRNNRLKRLLDLGAPEVIVRNEKRMLQESVDALIDSSRTQRYRVRSGKLPLKSLSDMLKGKQGRFRQNLLGKRVDYSGRSVIVAGPTLKMHEVGLPKEMAIELFKPFVIREILMEGYAPNPKSAKYFLEARSREVWDALDKVVTNYPVLLNRAPSLHRLSILAFIPRLIEGNAIRLHPCVCAGFNADFDGDQMSVHVPITDKAKEEAMELLLSTQNLLKPADGDPITVPNKEMVLGTYFLTSIDEKIQPHKTPLSGLEEARIAFETGAIGLRQQIQVLMGDEMIETSYGRLYFNEIVPESLGFINVDVEKKLVKKLIAKALVQEPRDVVVRFIDDMKDLGFTYATKSGISISIFDCVISKDRKDILKQTEDKAEKIDNNFKMGLITNNEKRSLLQNLWIEATDTLDRLTWEQLGEDNPVRVVVNAGASRASREHVKQLGGIKGLVYDATGKISELPIKGNFRLGLTGIEYFTGARGARKSLADTALKTADSGYLTRRLVDVAQDLIIREIDCGTKNSIVIRRSKTSSIASFADEVFGRTSADDIKVGTKVILKKGELITRDIAEEIDEAGLKEVIVRSPLTCETTHGMCEKCYGLDLGNQKPVAQGTTVGVIAAQSIGEPGTQLTLRTFHTGGIVGKDITQGLPRIEQLFEARTPKYRAVMNEIDGKIIKITENEDGTKEVLVKATKKGTEPSQVEYLIGRNYDLMFEKDDEVIAGTALTDGHLDLRVLLTQVGMRETQEYIVNGIQEVFYSQGVSLNRKHTEIIARQMFNKVQIIDPGDTTHFIGDVMSINRMNEVNDEIRSKKGQEATYKPVILGITRSALKTSSFLAAASFVETTRVLTDAALSGKVDRLVGLKENVMIGRLIPVQSTLEEDKK